MSQYNCHRERVPMTTPTITKFMLGASAFCLLAACDGNFSAPPQVISPPPPVADTQAPTVTMTASKTDPKGGETVILDATVTDDTDTGLSADLACDGGDLRGEFLKLPLVESEETITCDATASDSAGNTGSTSLSLTISPTTSTVALATEQSEFVQGEVGVLFVENVALGENRYAGKIGETDVTLTNTFGNSLSVGIPLDLAAGDYVLSFEIDGALYTFPVTVAEAETVADPVGVITSYLQDHIDSINNLIAEPGFEAAEVAALEERRENFFAFIDSIDQQATDDLQNVAKVIAANYDLGGTDTQKNASDGVSQETSAVCQKIFLGEEPNRAAEAAYFVGNFAMVIFDGFDRMLGDLVGNEQTERRSNPYLAKMRSSSKKLLSTKERCTKALLYKSRSTVLGVRGKVIDPQVVYEKALYKETDQTFIDQELAGIELLEETELYEEIYDAFVSQVARLRSLVESFDIVPQSLLSELDALEPTSTTIVQENVFLGAVTPGTIGGQLNYSGGVGEALFTFTGDDIDSLADGVAFTYELNDGSETYGTFDALLTATPSAANAMVTIKSNDPTQFDVPAYGSRLEVTSQPQKGRVDVIDENTLQYTYEGDDLETQDELKYTAILGEQRADEATVFLEIDKEDPFDCDRFVEKVVGEWSVFSPGSETDAYTAHFTDEVVRYGPDREDYFIGEYRLPTQTYTFRWRVIEVGPDAPTRLRTH